MRQPSGHPAGGGVRLGRHAIVPLPMKCSPARVPGRPDCLATACLRLTQTLADSILYEPEQHTENCRLFVSLRTRVEII